MNLFDYVFRNEGMLDTFLSVLDFPTRWSFLCTSKEVNSKAKPALSSLLQTKAVRSLWKAYRDMRTETHRRTEDFVFRGAQLGTPYRSFYTKEVDGKMKLFKSDYKTFLLQIMVFHGYCELIDWFFSDLRSCDGARIMQTIGVMGHWRILAESSLGSFLAFGDANRFSDDDMTKLVAQRGDEVFWDKIVAGNSKEWFQDYLKSVKDEFWLKRRKRSNRDVSPVRK